MKITISGNREYDIGFYYYPDVRTTMAKLVDLSTGEEYQEYSVASMKDQFSRRVGRKIALARALKQAMPGYEHKMDRTQVWFALVNRGMKLA